MTDSFLYANCSYSRQAAVPLVVPYPKAVQQHKDAPVVLIFVCVALNGDTEYPLQCKQKLWMYFDAKSALQQSSCGLTLRDYQLSTQPLPHSPPQEHEGENKMEKLMV